MALTEQKENVCLAAPGTYSFIISDAYEDGLCCVWGQGNYTVTSSNNNGEVLASGGEWKGPNEATTFTLDAAAAPAAAANVTPPPTKKNVPTLQPSSSNSVIYLVPTLQPTMYNASSTTTTSNNTTIDAASTDNGTITTQVNIYLTGVPNNNQNMTTHEQNVFETLLYTILHSRLETVDVTATEVVVDAQINNPLFDADSPFESLQTNNNNDEGGGGAVLQLITNVTLTYSDPPPEGWRDWSIYLTSWIESFGPTMVDIFTDPKHDLYPNEEFFNSISDVSATNVVPPNTDPTASPTLAPTYFGAPEYKKPLVAGLASSGVILIVLFFLVAVWYKRRRLLMTRTHNDNSYLEERKKEEEEEDQKGLGSLDNEDSSSSSQDDEMSDSLPSTVRRSNKGGDTGPRSAGSSCSSSSSSSMSSSRSRRYDDNNYHADESENIQTSGMKVLEEAPMPTTRQGALGIVAAPNDESLQDDYFAQYDKIVVAVSANNPNLTQVVLDNKHEIGHNDGGEALWQALATNKYVKLLSLRNSNIVDDQIAALAVALSENTSISHLSLENNNITSEGAEYLVVCLECNSTIHVVALEGNSTIDPRILDELEGILQSRGEKRRTVKWKWDLTGNSIDSEVIA
ncbi:hypothetical protein ACHAXM_004367 [Skeletonema potamos]